MSEEVLEVLDLEERADTHNDDGDDTKDKDARLNTIICIRELDLTSHQRAQLLTKLCYHFINFEGLHFYGLQVLFHDLLALHIDIAELAGLYADLDILIHIVLVLDADLVLSLLLGVEFGLHFLGSHFFGDFAALGVVDTHYQVGRVRLN